MRSAIWCHLYNLKNVKNTHEGVFSRFLNCTNTSKSRKASQMFLAEGSSSNFQKTNDFLIISGGVVIN